MPILTDYPVVRPDLDRFYEIDRLVRGHAFAIHNRFGRLLNETAYRKELARRCRYSGLNVDEEFRVRFQHGFFSKIYRIDLLVEGGVAVEVKAVQSITEAHKAQTLNYLFATDTLNGILLNMRPARVEHWFASTTHTVESRGGWFVDTTAWKPHCAVMARLVDDVMSLLREWGALLDLELYRDALFYLAGGAVNVCRSVELRTADQFFGRHDVAFLSKDFALYVTSMTSDINGMRDHLHRFLALTPLRALAWINFNHLAIGFETLIREPPTVHSPSPLILSSPCSAPDAEKQIFRPIGGGHGVGAGHGEGGPGGEGF